ncbi:GAF domain-containing protein [Maribacter sp. X9]|uniref:GAF domain-containing protein n=1 Tax=Maribacter sp. X9 TaxID=3402159 RepID=UPI003AF35627
MEDKRLEDVLSYELLDTLPEKDLDEITELASLICGTPISLITILDDKRQWFKSNKGLEQSETDIKDSFCQHALHRPNEVLVVKDALKDSRFIDNPLVLDNPNIRFYAGAPLVTEQNNVLGTLCIIDRKPREISREQKNALQILARRAMTSIELRKTIQKQATSIELNAKRLIKITENIPIGLYELKIDNEGKMKFHFLSKGMEKICPDVDLDNLIENPDMVYGLIHPDDVDDLKKSLANSIKNNTDLYHEYRIKFEQEYHWHAMVGKPERTEKGGSILYGSFTDVTHHYKYEAALEQISFDISHVLRRPVASMLGITSLLESEEYLSTMKLKEYSNYMKIIVNELEQFTRNLNDIYHRKKNEITGHYNRYKTKVE